MKITKALLKQIIQEEVQKVISEQTSFVQAGEKAAAKRAREMEGPSAAGEFLAKQGGAATAADMALAAMGDVAGDDIDFASADQTMVFEPEDVVAKKPRRGSNDVRQLQKAVGARQDGVPGPKTYGRFMKKANLKPSQLSYKQFMNLLRGPAAPQIIAGMIEMINTKTPGLVGQAVMAALGGAESLPMDKAVDTAVEAPSKAFVVQTISSALKDAGQPQEARQEMARRLMDLEGKAFEKEAMRQLDKVTSPGRKKSLMRRIRKMGL